MKFQRSAFITVENLSRNNKLKVFRIELSDVQIEVVPEVVIQQLTDIDAVHRAIDSETT